jgi:hypothetical protein
MRSHGSRECQSCLLISDGWLAVDRTNNLSPSLVLSFPFPKHRHFIMPKVKKLRAAALESQHVRHEPLGQVMEGDTHRDKYATPSRRRHQQQSNPKKRQQPAKDLEYLDEKTSQRILDMSREQRLEDELEEQKRWLHQRRQQEHQDQKPGKSLSRRQTPMSSDDEEEEEEEVDEIFIDEIEEE